MIFVVGIQLRFGYAAGLNDQFVLSPLGISWADGLAFKNDYFVENAVQPHIFFDWITKLGFSSGHLSAYYLAFWLLTFLIAAAAMVKFADFLSNQNVFLISILGALFVTAGPITLLGTTTIALPQALPHALGGAFSFLALASAIRKEWVRAGIWTIFATIAHVQHGSVAIAVVATLLFLEYVSSRKFKWAPAVLLLVSLGILVSILTVRPVTGNFADFVRVCDEYIPYHCNSSSWQPNRLITGLATFSMIIISASNRNQSQNDHFKKLMLILISASTFAISLDYFNIPMLGELVQAVNTYRINSIMITLGAICGAWIIVEAQKLTNKTLALGLSSIFIYLTASGDEGYLSSFSFIVAASLFWFYFANTESNDFEPNWKFRSIKFPKKQINIFVVIAVTAVLNSGLTLPRFKPNFMDDYSKSFKVEQLVAPGSTIAADPAWTWVRLATKRAVIVDCKYIPYGGKALEEYEKRLSAIGGYQDACEGGAFGTLDALDLDKWAEEYSAEYILLTKSDKRIPGLRELGWNDIENPAASKIEIRRSYDGHRIRLVLLQKNVS